MQPGRGRRPPASYLVNLGAAANTGLTLDDSRSVLIAVAPFVGAPSVSPRVVSAAGNIARALGLAVGLDEVNTEAEGA